MDLARDLLLPSAYDGVGPVAIELRETHISWVFLLERAAYKLKKPVDFGFLDFTTLEKRKAACDAEVVLNKRLAPRTYHGVVPVRRGEDDRAHIGGTEGEIVDYAVHMDRLPDATRADVLLAGGALGLREIDALATRIAAFHAYASADDRVARFGELATIARNVEENFAQTRESIAAFLEPGQVSEIVGSETAFLRDKAALFEARVKDGRVRDGHGDLRLEHAYFRAGGEITVLDCIEFNERFRFADVCADVAFFSMDLAAQGRVDLAEHFIARYAREANDFDLYALVDFYEGYRAFVRGKIASIGANDPTANDDARARAAREARRHFLLALACDRRSLLKPQVVAVGGIIASGKSTLAERIGNALGAPVVDADRTRKSMLGVKPHEHVNDRAWSGAYDPAFTDRVYDEVLRRAGVVLASGRPVVVDASFRSAKLRAAVRALAEQHGVPFRFVECRAPIDVCRARLVLREETGDVSDGRLAILDDFVARVEPVTEIAAAEHIAVDTTLAIDDNVRTLAATLEAWPAGFTG